MLVRREASTIPRLIVIIAMVLLAFITTLLVQETNAQLPPQLNMTRVIGVAWEGVENGVCPSPGDSAVNLLVRVQYLGKEPLAGIEATLELPWGLESLEGDDSAKVYLPGPIQPGGIVVFKFPLNVSDKLTVGEKEADLTLSAPGVLEETHKVAVWIGDSPLIEVRLLNLSALAGGENRVLLSIANRGTGEAWDLRVYLESREGLPLEPSTVYIGTLPGGEERIIELMLNTSRETSPRPLSLEVRLSGYDECRGLWEETKLLTLPLDLPPVDGVRITAWARDLRAGGQGVLHVALENQLPYAAHDIVLSLSLPGFLALPNTSDLIEVGSLGPGETTVIDLPLRVSSTAPDLGRVGISVAYKVGLISLTHTTSVDIPIEKPPRPQVDLNVNVRDTPVSGSVSRIKVTATNKGDTPAENAQIVVSAQPPAQVLGLASRTLGRLEPGEQISLSYNVYIPPGVSGTLQLRVSLSYEDALTGKPGVKEQAFALPIESRGSSDLTVILSPPSLKAGHIVPVEATVINTGQASLENVTITLSLPPTIRLVGVNQEWFIPELKPDEKAARVYYAYTVPQASGVETITVTLTYYKDGMRNEKVLPLGIPVVSPPTPMPSVRLYEKALVEGRENRVSLVVENRGRETAYNLTLNIQSPTATIAPPTLYVGTLPPGGSKEFRTTVTPSSPGPITLQLQMFYEDELGRQHSVSQTLGVKVLPKPTSSAIEIRLVRPNNAELGPGSHRVVFEIINKLDHPLQDVVVGVRTGAASPIVVNTGASPIVIGGMGPGESREIGLDVLVLPVQSEARASIILSVSYWDPENGPGNRMLETYFRVSPIPTPQLQASLEPTTIEAGRPTPVLIKIQNTGTSDWESVEATLTPLGPSSIIVGTSHYSLGMMPAGKASVINTTLYVPPTLGDNVALTLTLKLYQGGMPFTITSTLGFLVKKTPVLEVTEMSVIPEDVVEGQPFSLSITLSNLGKGAAEKVFLETGLPQGIEALSSTRVFVGRIGPGTSSTLTLSLVPQAGSAGDRTLSLRITYEDNLGNSYQETLEVPVRIQSTLNQVTGEGGGQVEQGSSAAPFGLEGARLIAVLGVVIVALVVAKIVRSRGHD